MKIMALRLWHWAGAQPALGRSTDCLGIGRPWLDLCTLNLHKSEQNAWPREMVFKFGYWERRVES